MGPSALTIASAIALPHIVAGFELKFSDGFFSDIVTFGVGVVVGAIVLLFAGFVLLGLIIAMATGTFRRNPKPPKLPSRMVKSDTEDSWISQATQSDQPADIIA